MAVLKATLCGVNKVEVPAVKENQQNHYLKQIHDPLLLAN
jgi:hypothetical protein